MFIIVYRYSALHYPISALSVNNNYINPFNLPLNLSELYLEGLDWFVANIYSFMYPNDLHSRLKPGRIFFFWGGGTLSSLLSSLPLEKQNVQNLKNPGSHLCETLTS